MASAAATLKLTPNELQVVAEALRMYAYANQSLAGSHRKYPLEGYQHDMTLGGGDTRRLARTAEAIRQDIGLK